MTDKSSIVERTIAALDDAFSESLKGLYAAAWSKVAGGESIDAAMKEFDVGLLLDVATLHVRIIAETRSRLANHAGLDP